MASKLYMNNTAKCPKCDDAISNVHYETHDPSSFSGYRGSRSFTAVAFPCGHAIGAVPMTWEMRLEEIQKTNKEVSDKLDSIFLYLSKIKKQDP